MIVVLSVCKVVHLLKILCTSEICEGNPDEKFLSLPNIHKNSLRNLSSKLLFNQ